MDPDSELLLLLIADLLDYINGVAILFLLICSALVSGSEIAFFSLSQTDIDTLKNNSQKENVVVKLLNTPKKLLATILITNNFINILVVLLFASLSEKLFGNFKYVFYGISLRIIVEIGLVTFLILLFGEVLPKVYAARNPLKFSSLMSNPILILNMILTPLSKLLTSLTSIVEDRLGGKKTNLSVEKLSQALELTSNDATTKNEQKILQGIVNFGNTETVQIMKPRIDIFAISEEESFENVLKMILEKGYARNPVYHENIDSIVGVLYTKDLLVYLNKKTFNWQKLIREPFFVPENKKLDDLLSEFRDKKNHLAIVVDEYGGTSGIVTLDDVIEEIVGDIKGELDDDDLSYSKIDKNTYVFEGKITIKDFCKVFDDEDEEIFEQEKGESETLAGFILEITGKIPKKNDKIKFKNYSFIIEAVNETRIKQVKATKDV